MSVSSSFYYKEIKYILFTLLNIKVYWNVALSLGA